MKKKSYLLSGVAALALTFANMGVSVNSWMLLYQPKMPQQLKK